MASTGLPSPPPNLDLTETQVPQIHGAAISTYAVAIIVVTLRFVARRISNTSLWWDDWLILPALACATVLFFTGSVWIEYSMGTHIWAATPGATLVYAKMLFSGELCYLTLICCVKFSMLCFYWRIFSTDIRVRIPIFILGGIVIAWAIAVFLVTILQCTPIQGYWERWEGKPATCPINETTFFEGNAIPNIITDVAIIILPLPFIWKLQLSRHQRGALVGIFLLGLFVTGVSITRLVFILNIDIKNPDITWNFVPLMIWTLVECQASIICACLPSLRVLLSLAISGSLRIEKKNGYLSGNNLSSRISRPRALNIVLASANENINRPLDYSSNEECSAIQSYTMENRGTRDINVRMDVSIIESQR